MNTYVLQYFSDRTKTYDWKEKWSRRCVKARNVELNDVEQREFDALWDLKEEINFLHTKILIDNNK